MWGWVKIRAHTSEVVKKSGCDKELMFSKVILED
jgi:hypothetical protein